MELESLPDEYANVGPGTMHFKHRRGSGTAVIFIPGMGASLKSWSRTVQYLDPDMDAYFIDLLGHGLSDTPNVEYTITLAKDSVNRFVEQNGFKKCILCGHSYGGWAAALAAPENGAVKGLILEDPAGLADQWNDLKADPARFEDMGSKMRNFLGNSNQGFAASMLRNLDLGRLDQQQLGRIRVPTLLIWGEKDEMVDIMYSRAFNTGIKGSTISVIRGAPHTPHYTNPQEVAELVNLFVPTV